MRGIGTAAARPDTSTWLREAAFVWKHLTTQRYEIILEAAALALIEKIVESRTCVAAVS